MLEIQDDRKFAIDEHRDDRKFAVDVRTSAGMLKVAALQQPASEKSTTCFFQAPY